MTNKLRTLMAFSAIGMSFAALPAFGGDIQPLHVSVPFAFTAGRTAMPAGEYTFSETESHVLMIRGEKSSVLLLSTPGSDAQEEKNSLSFERTSKGIELRSVHSVGHPASVIPAILNEK